MRPYKIPYGNYGVWVVGVLGILACVGAIMLGFVPPAQIMVGSLWRYEVILVCGILVLGLPPFIIYNYKKPEWKYGYQSSPVIEGDADFALEQGQ